MGLHEGFNSFFALTYLQFSQQENYCFSLPPGVPGETLLGARARTNCREKKKKKKKQEGGMGRGPNKTLNATHFIRCKA